MASIINLSGSLVRVMSRRIGFIVEPAVVNTQISVVTRILAGLTKIIACAGMIRAHIICGCGIGLMVEVELCGTRFATTVELEPVQIILRGGICLVGKATTGGRPFVISFIAEGVGVVFGGGIVLMGGVKVGSRRNMGHIEFKLVLLNEQCLVRKLADKELRLTSYGTNDEGV